MQQTSWYFNAEGVVKIAINVDLTIVVHIHNILTVDIGDIGGVCESAAARDIAEGTDPIRIWQIAFWAARSTGIVYQILSIRAICTDRS